MQRIAYIGSNTAGLCPLLAVHQKPLHRLVYGFFLASFFCMGLNKHLRKVISLSGIGRWLLFVSGLSQLSNVFSGNSRSCAVAFRVSP